MATHPDVRPHTWFTATDLAAQLEARKHGDHWRAACPAHGGDNPQSLSIKEGVDSYGHPTTLLHCFAHACALEDICAALGIKVVNLFCIQPAYAKSTRNVPRATGPSIDRLYTLRHPTPDDMAQAMLEEMIVSDPAFIQECQPARETLWRLSQSSPQAREAFTCALRTAKITPQRFWQALATEHGWERGA